MCEYMRNHRSMLTASWMHITDKYNIAHQERALRQNQIDGEITIH